MGTDTGQGPTRLVNAITSRRRCVFPFSFLLLPGGCTCSHVIFVIFWLQNRMPVDAVDVFVVATPLAAHYDVCVCHGYDTG